MTLLIVEGCDGAGKSTLIKSILDARPGATFYHCTAYLGEAFITHYYLRPILEAMEDPDGLTIMDRSWLAEGIYGTVMRKGENRIPDTVRMALETLAGRVDTRFVLCLPRFEVCEANWRGRLQNEYINKAEKLWAVHDMYAAAFNDWVSRGFFASATAYDYTVETAKSLIGRVLSS